jgi:hypothetical protein
MDWIKVSTPPTAEQCDNELLVAVNYPGSGMLPHVTRAYYSPDRGFWKESIRYLTGAITHWMPMPDLPVDEEKKCQCCGINDGTDLHKCPYATEINDSTEPCNCCKGCEYECYMDI